MNLKKGVTIVISIPELKHEINGFYKSLYAPCMVLNVVAKFAGFQEHSLW